MVNIFNEILGMSIDSVWLILAVIMTRTLLYKAPKYFHKILWGLVGLRLIIPFSFKSTFSLVPGGIPETADRIAVQLVVAHAEQSVSLVEFVSIMWGIIGFAFLCYGIISYLKLKIKIFDSVIYKDNIYYSEKIESPFVCGFIKPKIYIPYGLNTETQECVLQHEKMHIKYGDHILKYLGFVILCIHWFNPLVWVAYFLLCKDIELACDESVVKNYDADGCKKYSKALLELGVNNVKLAACPIAFGEVGIKKRIKSVINYRKAGKILVLNALCLCVVVAVCFMTEPEVHLKEKNQNTQTPEKKTEAVAEAVVEAETEAEAELAIDEVRDEVTEEAVIEDAQDFEPESEAVIEAVTESVIGTVTEGYAEEETTETVLKIEKPLYDEYFFIDSNPFFTEPYEEPDVMREQAEEAGVFLNNSEREKIAEVLENNIEQ